MMDHWLFRCRDISGLISRSYDERLPLRIRLGIRFHLMMCHLCARNKKQLDLIQNALAVIGEEDPPERKLPEHVRQRMSKIFE